MSFLKKIKNVLSFLSPWGAPSKPSRRRKSKKRRPVKKGTKLRKKARPKAVKKITLKRRPEAKTTGVRTVRKTAAAPKKKPAKKIATRSAAVKKPAAGKSVKIKLKQAPADRVMTGEVTHYFDRIKAAAFVVTGASIALGDELEFEDKNGNSFRQKITSLQMNRKPIRSARAGDEVGMLVKKPVREGDYVFKRLR